MHGVHAWCSCVVVIHGGYYFLLSTLICNCSNNMRAVRLALLVIKKTMFVLILISHIFIKHLRPINRTVRKSAHPRPSMGVYKAPMEGV